MSEAHDPTLPFATDPFLAPGSGWVRVSPRLMTVRRLVVIAVLTVATLLTVGILAASGLPEWGFVALCGGGLLAGWSWWVIGRQVRAIGYCERDDDLLVVSGVLFRRLVVVPYGRMQLVDVTRGPLDRYFGLATVQLHTAAATSDASIPGLTPTDAARLRDRLAALGEERSAGL